MPLAHSHAMFWSGFRKCSSIFGLKVASPIFAGGTTTVPVNTYNTRSFSGLCKNVPRLPLVTNPWTSFVRSVENVTPAQWKEQRKLREIHEVGPVKERKRVHALDEKPQMRGFVLKTLIKKPKKPNSGNRKCVLVRLTNGKEKIAYVPGIGHGLQEHSVVLVHSRRTKDVPGLRLKCIRGTYDLPHVARKSQT